MAGFHFGSRAPRSLFEQERDACVRNCQPSLRHFSEESIAYLPDPVRRHIRVCGYLGRPLTDHAEVVWSESRIRLAPGRPWMRLRTLQHNFLAAQTRLAYMHARMAGIVGFDGRDRYERGTGHMYGRLAGVIIVFDAHEPGIGRGGAVVMLAEALMEPSIALQQYIRWEPVDDHCAQATLTDRGGEVSGRFFFDDDGRYVRFESADRPYDHGKGRFECQPYEVLVSDYHTTNEGMSIAGRARARWHLDGEEFEYWDGRISDIRRFT